MLRPFYLIAMLLASLAIVGCSDTNEPTLGTHYQELPHDISDIIEQPVVEVFSLTCGHCMNLEKELPAIADTYGAEIGKVHVTFNDASRSAAMFYYAAVTQLDGKSNQEVMDGLFNLYHGAFDSAEQKVEFLNQLFTSQGLVSPYQLTENQIAAVLEQAKIAETVTSRARIQSVPTFIVKGKYLVNLSAHGSAEEIGHTLRYLTSL